MAANGSLLPYKRVLVGIGLYLGAVDILDFKTDELCIHKHTHYLGEDVVHHIRQTALPEQVDRVEGRTLHAAQPHEVDIALEQGLHLAA